MSNPLDNLVLAQHLAHEIGNQDVTSSGGQAWMKFAAHLIEELLSDDVEDIVRGRAVAHLREIPAAQRSLPARRPPEGVGIATAGPG